MTFTEEIHVISFLSCNKPPSHSSLININCLKLVLRFACRKQCRNAKYPSYFFLLELPSHWIHQAKITPSQRASAATNLQSGSLYLSRQLSSNRQCISACRSCRAGVSSEKWLNLPPLNPWVTASAFRLLLWFLFLSFFFLEGLAAWAILKDLEKSHKQELLNNCSVKLKITVCSTTVELLCGRRKLSF